MYSKDETPCIFVTGDQQDQPALLQDVQRPPQGGPEVQGGQDTWL